MDDRPVADGVPDEDDEGIIGSIEAAEVEEPEATESEYRGPRGWRRRRIMVGCLLALLGAFIGGGVAMLVGRDEADVPPRDVEIPADAIPMNRLTFSPTPQQPAATPDIIPAETEVIYSFYELGRLPADAELEGEWWRDGVSLGGLPLDNLQGDTAAAHARGRFELRSPNDEQIDGFVPGVYEVELSGVAYPDVAARASFVVLPRAARILQGGGDPEGPPVIRSLRTARGVTDEGEPVGAASSFPPDVGRVYAIFEYEGIMPGAVLAARWYLGPTEIERARTEIAIPASAGSAEAWLATGSTDLLPPGEYRVAIHLGDEADALASVGFIIEA